MGSYLSLGVSTFLLCLLLSSLWFTIAQSSESESKVEPIEVHELQITENKEKLSKLEAEGWNELGFSNITTSNETSLCKPYARQKLAELNVSRSLELEEYRNQLKRSHNQISDLSYNLTICSIKAQLHESESIDASTSALIVQIAELNAQIQAKDRQIEQLQQEMRWQSERLQSAQSELKAYDDQLDQFHPSSCLPFGITSGIYRIKLSGLPSFYAPCDARYAGGGWMVIQRRMDGSENFYRNWSDYRAGFGSLMGEFFIGLEKLHRLTASKPHELFLHLEDFEAEMRFAHYDNFSIGSEASGYELSSLGKYEGNAGNSLGLNVLQKFSTLDQDNDTWTNGSCARRYHGAWWYGGCAAFW